MSNPTLTPVNFLTSVTASTITAWYPVDYRPAGMQQRSVAGYRESSTGDEIVLECLIRAVNAAGNTIDVIATATSWAGGSGPFSAVLYGPANAVRIRKFGSSGAATVNALL